MTLNRPWSIHASRSPRSRNSPEFQHQSWFTHKETLFKYICDIFRLLKDKLLFLFYRRKLFHTVYIDIRTCCRPHIVSFQQIHSQIFSECYVTAERIKSRYYAVGQKPNLHIFKNNFSTPHTCLHQYFTIFPHKT